MSGDSYKDTPLRHWEGDQRRRVVDSEHLSQPHDHTLSKGMVYFGKCMIVNFWTFPVISADWA